MKTICRLLPVCFIAFLTGLGAYAQPSNNNFTNAWILTGTTISTNGNSAQPSNATKEPGEPNHAGFAGGRSVWFSWTAPISGLTRINTTNNSFNTLLGVYTGTAVNALTLVAANDNFAGLGSASQVEISAVAGTTYKIAIDGRQNFGGAASGAYTLTLQVLASVSITSPTAGTIIPAGTAFSIDADASVPGATVTRVDFYRNGALIGFDAVAPYSVVSSDAPTGTNSLFVVATDSNSRTWTSPTVNVAVLNRGVTITTPNDGNGYIAPVSIPVSAVGFLESGTVTNVDFFVDGQKFGQDGTSPFGVNWTGITEGVHTLVAIGTDNSGIFYTSAPVKVTIAQTLMPTNSVWKYLDTGVDLGTTWTTADFDDSQWLSGPAELGYGDTEDTPPRPEATIVSYGPDPANKYTTTYFRRQVVITNATSFALGILNVLRDDGAVVYLNGQEAGRFNMPTGPITYTTFANNATDDGTTFSLSGFSPSLLVEGTNIVAVEIHQTTLNSSDISFDLSLLGLPAISRNQLPLVSMDSPTNNAFFLGTAPITFTASPSDADGSVVSVDFFVDNTMIGTATNNPYTAQWTNVAVGAHTARAVATDDQAGTATAQIAFIVYDDAGTPLAQITGPAEGAVFDGPTNVTLSAIAFAPGGVTNVEFRSNGTAIASDAVPPYSIVWTNATFGTNLLTAVAFDAQGARGTSAPVSIVVKAPPPNLSAPTIAAINPAAGATITSNLTTIQVTFSEIVTGVNATDLRINDSPGLSVTGSGSNYTFTVVSPGVGTASVEWSANHGIADIGFPPLPFDAAGPGATWTYNIVDGSPPVIATRNPAAGATVSNLTQISVAFNESVSGVNAGDMLINGTPATGLGGGGASYTFSFTQPPSGLVNITWAGNHGIADLASPPNAFNPATAGNTWSYTLDSKTVLVESNSLWLFIKGRAEASNPVDAWRQLAFNDSSWSNSLAPFYYGDPYNTVSIPGTLLSDMSGGYTSIYLRKRFTVLNPSAVTNLFLRVQSDDGFVAWINGFEVYRYNVADGELPFDSGTPVASPEQGNTGAAYLTYTLPPPTNYIVEGTNVLVVHAFNQSLSGSSDFGFNAQLYTYLLDPSLVPPRIQAVTPPPGEALYLTNITVKFTEPVSGVSAGDLLVNGVAASAVSGGTSNDVYTFTVAQPGFGPVSVTWAVAHGIADFDSPPKPFDATAPGSTWQYSLVNPSAPVVSAQAPPANASVTNLPQIIVSFSEPVTSVDAADLLVNGLAALAVSGSGATYTFTLPPLPFGSVAITWAANNGITDLEVPANPFERTKAGNSWSYTLVDQIAPTIVAQSPVAGSQVTNLAQISVTFSEPVLGVDAADLLVNGAPAAAVSGSGANYTFTFVQSGATTLNVAWAPTHGIRDLAAVPNPFNGSGPGATWSYTTPDTVAPTVIAIDPPAFATVRSLRDIRVTFSEPVFGVSTNVLLINSQPALQVNGSGAGPYTFSFSQPPNGPVEIRWSPSQQIIDLANPPNAFGGGEWTYILDPNASFAKKVLINEIMFNPLGGQVTNEWIELLNVSSNLINLANWRFSRGVGFTFPNVAIPAGGYLVVAADTTAFKAKYPAVNNVIGGWTGQLANSDETVALETVLGEEVDQVHYATEGDWARRERGRGAQRVLSITRSGTTATVTVFNHGYVGGDQVMISGADQTEYNGRFTVNGASPSSFTITISGAPVTPATGNIICRHVVNNGSSGWSWFCPADGLGSSLELINPSLPSSSGQNWLSSTALNGTPGAANSVASNNIAPLIQDVTHFPPIPRSTNSVAISARLQDELAGGVQDVMLFYRNHSTTSPSGFASTNMFDDGQHSDGVAQDSLYGAILPPVGNGVVIEFYVQATDISGRTRTWPAAAWETNNTTGQFANALYQVDNETITNLMPAIRLVMTGTERPLFPPSNRNSDASMNVTMITMDGEGPKVRYSSGVRVRGAGTRSRNVPGNRVDIPNDNRWNGLKGINLNSQYVHAQLVGNVLAQKSGVPAADAHVVQYRINGVNPAPITAPGGQGAGWGVFLMIEPVNGDLAGDLFPEDGGGNVYRASTGNHNADLSYQGTDPNNYISRGYYKTANQAENDWTDLFNLTFAFSQVAANDDYVQAISTNVNVLEWMRYWALGSLLNYGETSLFNGIGDDYALYRGDLDRRFVVLGHDFDTIFGQGDTGAGYYPINTNSSIYLMINPPNGNVTVPLLRRLVTNAPFAPLFFSELKRLADTIFHPSQLNPLIDQLLTGWGVGPDAATISSMKNWAAGRRAVVLSQIPLTLTVGSSLPLSSGLPFTTTPNATLFGFANAIDTRKVLVNGIEATWSAWEARWTNSVILRPGVNRVLVESLDSNNVAFASTTMDVWYDDGTVQTVSGAIATDTIWSAANGPFNVTASISVASGATLIIQPGTTVYLGSGMNITIANGGRLLAEGTATAPIRFTRTPGAATTWGGITVNGGPASPETRIAYAHFEFNNSTAIHSTDGTLFLDHLTFGNTAVQYVSLDRSSFVVQNCVFPTATAQFELVHGTGGVKAGGRALFLRNFFGVPIAYNDVVDFTGGNRPGPIVQFINNVFIGATDDILDLDSTDAWVEGNIFLHAHKNGSPDSASAISGGSDNADTSEITIIGNIIYDCDQAANAKQGNFYTLINNTIVHQNHSGGTDTNGAVALLSDVGTTEGAGMYLEGNIIYDAEKLVFGQTASIVTFTNNLTQLPWSGPGGNNSSADPLLTYVPLLAETTGFTSWQDAQVMWDWFGPKAGSPAVGRGPNGQNIGATIPRGVSISGEPIGTTPLSSATLRVGVNRTGSGIPTAGFPTGSGYSHYKWRLDNGVWSAETPMATPISLNSLGAGPHYVEVVGKRDSGFYQDDPVYGMEASITVSRTWTVQPSASTLRLNELLASNGGALNHAGTTPDAVEIHNAGPGPVDLGGVGLTDDPSDPTKFLFPLGTTIGSGEYLVVFANNPDGTLGFHLGFNLNQSGDALYLYDSPANGGALIDAILFGPQLTDLSIGRLSDGSWGLTQPTFGSANIPAAIGDPTRLRINEWLAIAEPPFDNDFVELYNPDSAPVNLGALYMSDEVIGWPDRHRIPPLSFIPANGYLRFIADGDAGQGAEHLNFRLTGQDGAIGLYLPDLTLIDIVFYRPQRPNISQGRSPNGSPTIVSFDQPTPGAPNPLISGTPGSGGLVINEVLAANSSFVEPNGRTPDWVELYNGTASVVDLSDMSLTDDTLQARRFVFAIGTAIPASGFLRVFCDDGVPASTTNTGFGLKASGGSVYLFDKLANSGGLLNSITYGIQITDFSIGRDPDGSTNWVLTIPTVASANVSVPTLGDPANLRVNEWMAAPPSGEDDWFEIYNPNTLPVALGGLHLSDDFTQPTKHTIASLSFIGIGTNAWQMFIAKAGSGADHVDFSFKSGGEDVGIFTESGLLIDGYSFGLQAVGVSEGRFPDGNATIVAFPGTASPGGSNYRLLTDVVINEALTHTDEPLEDAIELANLTGAEIDISGWWLSDDKATVQKYQIPPGTKLPPYSFAVIYENQFTNRNIAAIPFALSSKGDEVVLSTAAGNALTGFRTSVKFGAAANAASFGRYVNSIGEAQFVAMSARTFGADDPGSVQEFRTGTGATNAYPKVGPVVISEIMYHPPNIGAADNVQEEFIELHNLSSVPVALYDIDYPTNVWHLRDAVDFDFPPGTVIGAGEYLLIVSFDPVNNPAALAAFRNKYNVDTTAAIVGPYTGKLANDTDDIELRRPDAPDTNGVPYILVEHVRYADNFPWPADADGSGLALQRVVEANFANDPANWVAAAPTPGPQNPDKDHDGMLDAWERDHNLNPNDAADAAMDSDGDGMLNLDEFRTGTDPRDPDSVLRLTVPAAAPNGNRVVSFTAVSNFTYSVLWKESVDAGKWTKLADVEAQPFDRVVAVEDPLPPAVSRIYRVVTPQQAGPVNPTPAILASPRAAVTEVGQEANFDVQAFGDGLLGYQWSSNGIALPATTGSELKISNAQFSNMAMYSVRVTDSRGSDSSRAVYLALRPKIVDHPTSQSLQPGDSVTFSVTADGVGVLAYRWRHDGRIIPGQTNSTLVIDHVQAADAGRYSVRVTHWCPGGFFSSTSSNAVLTVNSP